MNLKSLLLTTVATLGLAANVQACRNCRTLLYGPIPTNEEVINYARKNADALLKEYEATINDSKTLERLKSKVTDFVDTAYQTIEQINQKPGRNLQELFEDAKVVNSVEAFFEKTFDWHGIVDTAFTPETAPQLNALLHKFIAIPTKYFNDARKHIQTQLRDENIRKKIVEQSAGNDFNRLQKALIDLEQQKRMTPTIINLAFDFALMQKPLLLQSGRALHDLLKDDEFFAKVENDTEEHTRSYGGLPRTAAYEKFVEAVKAFATPIEAVAAMVKHVQQAQSMKQPK